MIGQPMPQDILKHESKFALGLSTRQCIFYGIGAALALVGFFYIAPIFEIKGTSAAILGAVLAIPFFVWGTIKPFGENPEKIMIPFIIDNFIAPSVRLKEVHDEEYEKAVKIKTLTKKQKKKQLKAEKKAGYQMIL